MKNAPSLSAVALALSVSTLTALSFMSPSVASPGHSDGNNKVSPMGKAGDPAKVTRTIQVEMNDNMRFVPSSITVRANETVRFIVRNVGQVPHEMMLGTQKDLVEHAKVMQNMPTMEHEEDGAVSVEPGGTREMIWQFGRAANFKFGCLKPGHFEQGMVGNLTIQR